MIAILVPTLKVPLRALGRGVIYDMAPFLESMVIMSGYSQINKQASLLEEEHISLTIPGGMATKEEDWYPFVMTFVADEAYARMVGEQDAKLTILYNFPAFSLQDGASRLYDEQSPYYNSFYGAYLVRDSKNSRLTQGEIDVERVADIAKFDFFRLVLGDFGLPRQKEVFDFTVTDLTQNVTYLDRTGWTKITADILVNGAAHHPRDQVVSYLQYGAPEFGVSAQEFQPVSIQGIVYAQYFEEWDVGLYFYVMGSKEVCDACDTQILQKSRLSGAG
jgi:hypothetical protein